MENRFNPEEYLISNNKEQNTWRNLNLACIESLNHLDFCRESITVKRLPQIPPSLNLNLGNISFPQINLGNLPEGLTLDQINAMVQPVVLSSMQNILTETAKQAIKELMKSLPQKGFERIKFNSGWETEK